jgi:hypothetical protein
VITLFPKGFDQLIAQVIALFVPYLVLVFPGRRRATGFCSDGGSAPFMKHWRQLSISPAE